MVRLVKSAMNAFEGEYQDGHPSKATRMTKDALETIHEALEEVVTAFFIGMYAVLVLAWY
jgi:multidrug efflux pump subunit AcrB